MPIDPSTIQPPDSPDAKYVWGYDTSRKDWVPVDRQALEGSTLGNLARAAGRGMESVYQGTRELTTGVPVDPNLVARQQAAGAGAPIAEAVGGYAPELLAGGGAAMASGGLSLIPSLMLEGAAAGATSALRPGTFGDRMLAAAESFAGQAVGSVAARGIAAGVGLGRGIMSATTKRVADGVEAGAARVQSSADELAAVEAEHAQASAAEAAAGPSTSSGQGLRSVGAAQTPESELGQQYSEVARALNQTEAGGGDISGDVTVQHLAQRADELGMRRAAGFGTRQGSVSRLVQGVHDLNPWGDVGEQMVRTNNQEVVGTLLQKALGADNPKGTNMLPDMAALEDQIGKRFEYVESRLPAQMPKKGLATELGKISNAEERGFAGTPTGQRFLDNAVASMNASEGEMMTAAQWMDTRRTLQAEMARLYAKGETVSGETVGKAVERMDNMATRYLRGKGRDRLMDYWERSRQQYRVLMAAKRAGAVDLATGDVNPATMLRGLIRDRSSGGFGLRGPQRGTPERDLYDALRVQLHNQSGIPMTGARMVTQKVMRGAAGKVAAPLAGIFGAKSIFD